MSNEIFLIGDVGYEVTLQNVIDQVKETDPKQPITASIHSPGGCLYEGVAIYNYLKSLPQEVNTKAIGIVASSASIFFLAGKTRTAYPQNRILIHNPLSGVIGNAKDLEVTAKDLRQEEQKIADIYVAETNFTKEEALFQMEEDRMFTTAELLEKGFITELKEFKAVARLDNKKENMTKEELSKEELSGINKLVNFLGLSKKEDKPEIKNIIVKTVDQKDLDFFERTEGEPEVGDKVSVDGETVTETFEVAEGEDIKTFTVENGVLTAIAEPESDEDAPEDAPAEDAEMLAKIATLEAENASLKAEVTNKVDRATLEAKELELTTLQANHTALVNKLEAFSSTEIADTVNKEVKNELKTKASLKEALEATLKN